MNFMKTKIANEEKLKKGKDGFYNRYIKRGLDIVCSTAALTVFSPLFLTLTVVGAVEMKGNPFFTQERPGKDEKIFKLIKFRTMTNEKDENGELLPDEVRLNGYGKFLRSTSLDELPEAINILKGDMSVVGPRPQLVRDMVFMTEEQKHRHEVRPGLSGLAQVRGRNAISWEDKLSIDLEYIEHITFLEDTKIVLQTIGKFLKREDITAEGMATADDYGDALLKEGKVSQEEYKEKQEEAKRLLLRR